MIHFSWPLFAIAGLGLWPDGYDDAGDAGDQGGGGEAPTNNEGFSGMSEFDGWVWPMTTWRGYSSAISQEYKPATHHGVDIMFPRARGGGEDQQFAAGTSQGTPKWFCPNDVQILAPRDGYIWSSGTGPTGKYVVLSTAKPIAIFLVHMSELYVPEDIERGDGRIKILAGQPLGRVGYSPRDGQKLNHLHIEIWRNGGAAAHVDPKPYLSGAIR